jgi:ABC-type sugar transport system substrate-binding protein
VLAGSSSRAAAWDPARRPRATTSADAALDRLARRRKTAQFFRDLADRIPTRGFPFRATIPAMPGTIGLFLRSQDNDYQQRLHEAAVREGKRSGFDVVIESAQNDPHKQVAQIQGAIERAAKDKVVAILVSCVRDDVLAPLAEKAASAGLEWVLLNREAGYLDELRRSFTGRAIFSVTPDQTEIGRIQGGQVKALVPAGGRILCVTGPVATSTAQRRLAGLTESIGEAYALTVLHADWTSEGARLAVERWQAEHPDAADMPAAVVAQNDEMALGIRQALRDADVQRNLPLAAIPITGCDGSQTFGQRLVREGRLRATVVTPPASGPAVEWIARSRGRGEIPPAQVSPPVTSFPPLANLER